MERLNSRNLLNDMKTTHLLYILYTCPFSTQICLLRLSFTYAVMSDVTIHYELCSTEEWRSGQIVVWKVLLYDCVVYYCSVYYTTCNSDVAVKECRQNDIDIKLFPYIFFISQIKHYNKYSLHTLFFYLFNLTIQLL